MISLMLRMGSHLLLSAGSASLSPFWLMLFLTSPLLGELAHGFASCRLPHPLSFLLICDLTSGQHHYRCPLLCAHCAPWPFLLCPRCLYHFHQHSLRKSCARQKTSAKHCHSTWPTPSWSCQSQKLSGVDILIARNLYIYHGLSDFRVNAFQSPRSIKINCKKIKTAN